jgi:GTPase SAR1 family protein
MKTGKFVKKYDPTVGTVCTSFCLSTDVKLNIFDTAGQERYHVSSDIHRKIDEADGYIFNITENSRNEAT